MIKYMYSVYILLAKDIFIQNQEVKTSNSLSLENLF